MDPTLCSPCCYPCPWSPLRSPCQPRRPHPFLLESHVLSALHPHILGVTYAVSRPESPQKLHNLEVASSWRRACLFVIGLPSRAHFSPKFIPSQCVIKGVHFLCCPGDMSQSCLSPFSSPLTSDMPVRNCECSSSYQWERQTTQGLAHMKPHPSPLL